MIVEGQIHGGLAEGVGIALMQHDRVRRGGQLPRRVADGLPDPDARSRCPTGSWARRSRRRRTTRSAPRASASRRPSARRRRSSTRSSTRCSRSACATSTCPCTPARVWEAMQGQGRAAAMIEPELAGGPRRWPPSARRSSTATVVRGAAPTSVRPGDAALVLGDGTIEGFVGGVVRRGDVRLHALRALETGEPLLLRIVPGRRRRRPRRRAPWSSHNPCLSGGALEIFLEPRLPAPRVVVVGETPIARRAGELGGRAGLRRRAAPARDAEPGDLARRRRLARRATRSARCAARSRPACAYVGLVASARRGAAVLDALRRRGADERARAASTRRRAWTSARGRRGDRALDPRRDRRGAPRAGGAPARGAAGRGASTRCAAWRSSRAGVTARRARGRPIYFCCDGLPRARSLEDRRMPARR